MNYIGIDLGTTISAICSYDGETVRLYKSPDQNDVTPQDPKLSQKLDERKRGTAPRSVRLRLSAGRYVSRDGGRVT